MKVVARIENCIIDRHVISIKAKDAFGVDIPRVRSTIPDVYYIEGKRLAIPFVQPMYNETRQVIEYIQSDTTMHLTQTLFLLHITDINIMD